MSDLTITASNIRIDTYKHPQRVSWDLSADNGVRITHLPTGLVAECHEARSQHENKHSAMVELEAKVANFKPSDVEDPREYLIDYMERNFTDRTFTEYIRNHLAGDFAYQLAGALKRSPAQPQVPSPAVAVEQDTVISKNAARYDYWKDKLVAVDFDYEDSGETVIVLSAPSGIGYTPSLDDITDKAMQLTSSVDVTNKH